MIERRAFITIVGGSLIAAQLAAEGQQAGKVYRIGFITLASLSDPRIEAFRKGMSELGYIESKTISID